MRNAAAVSSTRLGELGGSKNIYRKMVEYYISDQLAPSAGVSALFVDALLDMPEVTRAGPAQELALYFQAQL